MVLSIFVKPRAENNAGSLETVHQRAVVIGMLRGNQTKPMSEWSVGLVQKIVPRTTCQSRMLDHAMILAKLGRMKRKIKKNRSCDFAVLLVYWVAVVTSEQVEETIETVLSLVRSKVLNDRPPTSDVFVTLAFAQSLDGKIAQLQDNGILSSNLAISGPKSLLLTHGLRSLHDGILIGRNTAEIDSPRLTNRLYACGTSHQPRPIILDPRNVLDDGALKNFAQRPIIVVAKGSKKWSKLNCDVIEVRIKSERDLDLHDMLFQLRTEHGLKSIMVEGGAATLTSFLREELYNCICITLNPELVLGPQGLSAFDDLTKTHLLRLINVVRIGADLQLTFVGRK